MLEDMKITVCFGATKIIVPCGSELPVRELVQQAIVRYRKVTNKVSIPKLKSLIVSFIYTVKREFFQEHLLNNVICLCTSTGAFRKLHETRSTWHTLFDVNA